MVELSLANPKVPGSVTGPASYEACCMHLTPGVVNNFTKADSPPMYTKISQISI